MQRRKILAATFALLLVGIIAPSAIPRAHADQATAISTSGYVVKNYQDPFYTCRFCGGGGIDALKAGSTFYITVIFQTNNQVFQRNMSLGIKFDWMTTYQNSTMASPQNQFSVYANQIAYLTLNYTVPNLTGQYQGLNLALHTWTVQVWDTQSGKTWSDAGILGPCPADNGRQSCSEFRNNNPVAIYSSTQASGVLARQTAIAELSALALSLSFSKQAPPGTSQAVSLLSQASAEMSLGDTSYQNGDFNTANTHYQNALNDANAAQSSLSFTGGGTDTATLTSTWITAAAILMAGIAAILVGFAGFKFLRSRSKSLSTYTPATVTPKP